MKTIPYRGMIMVKPMTLRPISRIVTPDTVLADRSNSTSKMPGVTPTTLPDEMHFIQGTVIQVGLGYPEGATLESVPGMDEKVPRQPMDTKIADRVIYSFNNPLNPVFEIETPEGIIHLMREDAVMIIYRNDN